MLSYLKSLSLSKRVLIAFLLAIPFGLMLGESAQIFSPIGQTYINAIKMLVFPLLFFSITVSIFSFNDPAKLSKLGIKTIGTFLFTALSASLIGLFVGTSIDWTSDVSLETTEVKEKVIPSIGEVFSGFVPSNIVDAMASGQIIPLIVFSILLGVALLKTDDAASVKKFFIEANSVMHTLVKIILAFTPIGVFALLSSAVGQFGLDTLAPLMKFIIAIYAACLLHMTITYSSLVYFIGKMNPLVFFKKIFEAQVTAYSTCSSYATLPVTTKVITDNLKVNKGFGSFVANIGSNANMDGCGGIYPAIAAIFIASLYNIPLDFFDYMLITFTAVLASIGTAGVPGAALVMLTVTLNAVGLPLEGIAFIAAIDRIIDMIRTTTNVTGDTVTALVVAQSEGLVEDKKDV